MSGTAAGAGFNVAVVGATGLVGETMIEVLEERNFPVRELFALASERSLGKSVSFRGKHHPVGNLADFDFSRADIGLFSPGAEVSREYAPKAAAAGCVVIDNTSEFRYEDEVPLVVPEVNRSGHRAVHQPRHHRQSQLFHHPDGRGAQAAARCGRHEPHQCRHLPVRVGRRP